MSQIAEELTFAVLSVTKFENSRCSWDFLELSQEAKVIPFLSSWPSTAYAMSFGHRGYPKNAKKRPTFGTILNFLWKILKTGDIVSQISPWKQRLQKKQSIPWRSRQKMPCDGHQECIPRPIIWRKIPRTKSKFFRFFEFVWKSEKMGILYGELHPLGLV